MIVKILKKASLILFNAAAITFGLSTAFSALCDDPDILTILNENLFGSGSTETFTSGKPAIYYKTWYRSIKDEFNGSSDFAKAAESEGAVLLKNDQGTLPLAKNEKVSLFGVTAYDPIYCLVGAGKNIVNNSEKQFFADEFRKAGLDINSDLETWYKSNTSYRRSVIPSISKNSTINGASWSTVDNNAKNKADYKTAIFVIGRVSNEGVDLPPYTSEGNSGLTDNDYLKLTSNEKSVLQGLKAKKDAGEINKIIVLFNTSAPIQDKVVNNSNYGIDAAMWIGFPGGRGISAVANLLVGKSNPSGRLTSTWYSGRKENPNWDYYATSNSVIYQEGVYVGYKYAETRYEDTVLGSENVGDYDYANAVNFTFGHGLSYTNFSRKINSLTVDTKPTKKNRVAGDDLIANVTIKNEGNTYSGKEVVQIYAQQPITSSNKDRKVEKPSVELVGFAKTKVLAPGESQTLDVKIDANKTFAAFDRDANGYILDQGQYLVTLATDAHNAVNNILAFKGKSGSTKMVGTGDASLVKTYTVDAARSSSYKYWTQGGNQVEPLFDMADPNRCDPNGNQIKFLSRYNWTGTITSSRQSVTTTTLRNKGKALDNNGDFSNAATNFPYYSNQYPTYGKTLDTPLKLVDMIGVEYEDSQGATAADKQKWNDFLDQLTWDETVKLVGTGRRMTTAIPSIGKPKTNDLNASNGISWQYNPTKDSSEANGNVGFGYYFDKNNRNFYPTAYPCEGIIASTFNIELAEVIGQSMGEDALWAGTSGLYGFGFNLHRNPYHGRTGEYYSEDPYLSGVIGGYESKGAQSKGLYVYSKHFVLNDQETTRSSYSTWITEQALRQTHLRPFELAIEIGDAMNVMTAFSRIGTYWTGNCYNLMTKCLRGELGMRGFAVTDWYKSNGMGMRNGLLAGQDLPDGTATSELQDYGPGKGYGYLGQAARVSAQRILYTVANSNAMNFYGIGTIIIVHDPEWYGTRDTILRTIKVVFFVTAGLAAITVTSTVIEDIVITNKKRKK